MEAVKGVSLVVNAPEFFEDSEFMEWLNSENQAKFTWHDLGRREATEYSDVVVLVDPSLNGEGSDSDMPEYIWAQILALCRDNFADVAPALDTHIHVRITNLN